MNLIKYLKKLSDKAKEQGQESPTALKAISPVVRVNRKERRKTAKQAHNYSDTAKRKPHGWRKSLKAKRKLGRR